MHAPGAILLISCYELGHRPAGLTRPLRALEAAGFAPDAIDIAVEPLDVEKVARAQFIGISVPMHTALRLGVHLLHTDSGNQSRCPYMHVWALCDAQRGLLAFTRC